MKNPMLIPTIIQTLLTHRLQQWQKGDSGSDLRNDGVDFIFHSFLRLVTFPVLKRQQVQLKTSTTSESLWHRDWDKEATAVENKKVSMVKTLQIPQISLCWVVQLFRFRKATYMGKILKWDRKICSSLFIPWSMWFFPTSPFLIFVCLILFIFLCHNYHLHSLVFSPDPQLSFLLLL